MRNDSPSGGHMTEQSESRGDKSTNELSAATAWLRLFLTTASLALAVFVLAACTPSETEGGTPIPGMQSGAPLYDEAVGPSDRATELDE